MHTPWGQSDSQKQQAEGITFYGTPSHGGFKLSAQRLHEMPVELESITPWAGRGWYEEDCDYNIVVLAFPQFFTPYQIYAAVNYATRTDGENREHFDAFFKTLKGSKLMAEHDEFFKNQSTSFSYGGLGTAGENWRVTAYSLDGKTCLEGYCKDYPELKSPFTEEQARATFQNVKIETIQQQAA